MIVRPEHLKPEPLVMRGHGGVEILDGKEPELQIRPPRGGTVVGAPARPFRPWRRQVEAMALLEQPTAMDAGAAFAEHMDVVGHDAVDADRVERFEIGQIRFPVVRVVGTHEVAVVGRVGVAAGVALDLPQTGNPDAVHPEVAVGVLAEPGPGVEGALPFRRRAFPVGVGRGVDRVVGEQGGMVLHDVDFVAVAAMRQLRQRLGQQRPEPMERPTEMRAAEGDRHVDAGVGQALNFPVQLVLRVAEDLLVVVPQPAELGGPLVAEGWQLPVEIVAHALSP